MPKKIVLSKYGPASVLSIQDFNDFDQLGDDEIAIDVAYSGINFADIMMRLGLYPDAPALPFTPGYEISGIVSETGANVTHVKPGDKVLAGCHFGGYSSKVVLPSWQVLKLGAEMGLEQGASLVVSYVTAYLALFEEGRVRDGDKLLIDCATGALGGMFYELTKNMNVEVVGLTSSEAKKSIITSRGWKAMTHQEFENSPEEKNFQFALNSLGAASVKLHYNRLSPSGKMVCIGASSFFEGGKRNLLKALKSYFQMPKFSVIDLMNDNRGVMGINALKIFEHQEYMAGILATFRDYDLHLNVDKVFPAHEVEQAHRYIENKQARGKVLLQWTN